MARSASRAILEVFHAVHALVAGMGTQDHLVVRIVPRLIDRVEHWIGRALQRPGVPSRQDIFAELRRARSWSRSASMPRSRSPRWPKIAWAWADR